MKNGVTNISIFRKKEKNKWSKADSGPRQEKENVSGEVTLIQIRANFMSQQSFKRPSSIMAKRNPKPKIKFNNIK